MRRHGQRQDIQALQRLRPFQDWTRAELRILAGLTTRVSVPAGTRLASEGIAHRQWIVIEEGVALACRGGDVVGGLGPGSMIGELIGGGGGGGGGVGGGVGVSGGVSAWTVSTTTPSTLLVAGRQELAALRRHPLWNRFVSLATEPLAPAACSHEPEAEDPGADQVGTPGVGGDAGPSTDMTEMWAHLAELWKQLARHVPDSRANS